MPETDLNGAVTVMEDIRKAIAAATLPDLHEGLTASVGVAALEPADTQDALFRRVDAALYVAKKNGRDQVQAHMPPLSAR